MHSKTDHPKRPTLRPAARRALETHYPFTSHFQRINGHACHYIDRGRGDPLVMVHGNPSWSFYYRRLILALSDRFRTIAVDHIGCGLSEKPAPAVYDYTLARRYADFEQFIASLYLTQKLTLIVHDWGGMIGMLYAVNHPEVIGRIVILNTAAFPPPAGKPIPWQLKLIRNFPLFATPAVLGANIFARGALYLAVCRRLPADIKAGYLAPYNCWSNRIATLRFVQDIPLSAADPGFELVAHAGRHLDRLQHIPMLILWGKQDFVFDRDYYDEWRRRFPHAQATAYADAGHYILEDKPGETFAAISNFLATNPLSP